MCLVLVTMYQNMLLFIENRIIRGLMASCCLKTWPRTRAQGFLPLLKWMPGSVLCVITPVLA
jgi:hypothetical protein